MDLAAQVGIGEVVAQEDRFHGADEFFQRLIPQHSALLVARSLAPRARHHPVDRDLFARVVVLGPSVAVGVATQQFQRVYHRPVGRVVAPEIERGQQLGQHSPVVTGVGTGRHRADSASEGTSVGFLSPHGQGRATSTRRPPGTAPPTRLSSGRSSAASASANSTPSLFRTRRRSSSSSRSTRRSARCVHSVDQADQQIDQRVSDLALPSPAQRREQSQAHRSWCVEQVGRIGPHCPCSPRLDQLLDAARAVSRIRSTGLGPGGSIRSARQRVSNATRR